MSRGEGMMRVTRFGWMPLAAVVSMGCLGSSIDGSGGGGSGGTAVTAGDGADSASGGSDVTASGGASDGATGGTPTGSGGVMTEAEWAALTAPRTEPHEIWTYDACETAHPGSDSVRVGQEYSVIPTVGTSFDVQTNVYYEVLMPYCMTSADCTDESGGVCQGHIGDAFCQYPEPLPKDPCSVDADCTQKPDGTCVPPYNGDHRLCHPTGVCEDVTGECKYAGDVCTGDADCSERAGGTCVFPVHTNCQYGTCASDEDCESGQRCGCGFCIDADCTSDESCPEGETCHMSKAQCFGRGSFHCSTPNDECTAGEPDCFYNDWPEPGWGGLQCLTK